MLSKPIPPDEELAPETLVPRLGEYLLEKGLISAQNLQAALTYQSKKASNGKAHLLGHALLALGYIDRESLDKVILEQIFSLHAALVEANRQLEQRVHQDTIELEKRTDQIQTTAKLTEVATSSNNLEELLKGSVELIVTHLRYEHAAIFLLDETRGFAELRVASSSNQLDQDLRDNRIPLDSHSLVSWVAQHNQSRVVTDASQEPLFAKCYPFKSACAEVGIPINANNMLLGVLHIQQNQTAAFDSDALATLQTIANLIAIFIQNYTLLETTQHNLKHLEKRLVVLETLDQFNIALSAETNLADMYKLIHKQVVHFIGEVDFLIALYSKGNDRMEIPYAIHNGSNLILPPHPLGQSLISIVKQSKKPLLLVKDVKQKAEELGDQTIGKSVKSWLGTPLIVDEETIGVIVLQDNEMEERFDDDDQRLLSDLAAQVAISIRNAIQLENTKKQADRERIAAEISTKLWASTDIHTILQTAIQEISQHLEAAEGVIQLQVPATVEIAQESTKNGPKGEKV